MRNARPSACHQQINRSEFASSRANDSKFIISTAGLKPNAASPVSSVMRLHTDMPLCKTRNACKLRSAPGQAGSGPACNVNIRSLLLVSAEMSSTFAVRKSNLWRLPISDVAAIYSGSGTVPHRPKPSRWGTSTIPAWYLLHGWTGGEACRAGMHCQLILSQGICCHVPVLMLSWFANQ